MRAYIKSLLQDRPALYVPTKAAFRAGRRALDWLAFKLKYPAAIWIAHSTAQVHTFKLQGFNSQFGQDRYLATLFKELKGECYTGYFVDVGANEPILINNSLYFERAGWTGLAIDPIQRFQAAWALFRKTPLISAAVSENRDRRTFVEILPKEGWEHTLSGFEDCVRAGDIALYGCRRYPVDTAPLSDLVPNDLRIDLLLIDVEGAEKFVIKGADLPTLRPLVIMIENVGTLGGDNELRKLVEQFGYRLRARIGATDDVFVATGN